jgi:hypothetical protein
MSEMVERVADALKRKIGPSIDPRVCEMAAKIAIEAMREPTEAMLRAAKDRDDPFDIPAFADEHWQAMIHAALNDPA